MNENILQSFKSESAPCIKLLSLKRKSRTLNHWNKSFLKWIPSRFMLMSTWNISILPAHLLRMHTWENLIFALGLNENANSFFATRCCFWGVTSSCFPGNGCTQSSTALTNTALKEIDQSDQSPEISVTQRRGLEKWIVERIVWESLS